MAALKLKNNKGQAAIEWLLLLATTFITAYVIITGPFADFTAKFLGRIKAFTNNIVMNGESDAKAPPPLAPKRFKPVHL